MRIHFLILFSVLLAFIGAQDCNNPLLSFYGIQGLPNPESASELAYCTSLKTGQTCCSSETVTSFQDKINSLVERLHNFAAARDLYLAQLKERYIEIFYNFLEDLNLNNFNNFDENTKNQITSTYETFTTISNELQSINHNFYGSLYEYQRARIGCFTTMLNVQASAWCLACDPNYATKGVSQDGTISFSDNLCKTVTTACYPFLEQGVKFNPLLRARQSLESLKNIQAYVKNSSGDSTDNTDDNNEDDFVNEFPNKGYVFKPISSQKTVTIPEGCDGTNCPWQCQNLFAGSQLNELLLANGGGILGGADLNLEQSETESPPSRRILQDVSSTTGVWEPDLNASGFQINVSENPGDVAFSDDDDTHDSEDGFDPEDDIGDPDDIDDLDDLDDIDDPDDTDGVDDDPDIIISP